MDESLAVQLFANAFRCEPIETEHSYSFPVGSRTPHSVSITKSDLGIVIPSLSEKSTFADLWLTDDKHLEILVREEGYGPSRSLRGDPLVVRDDDNGVTYTVASPSDGYVLFFLHQISQHSDPRLFMRGFPAPMLDRMMQESDSQVSIFEILTRAYLRIKTVNIQCDSKTTVNRMSTLANAFLFQLAFNTDIALVPQREMDGYARAGRISRMRRNRPAEIDPPRRTYNPDLIHHYLLAVSTDNPVVEYLSHYHTLEHFYEAVFHDDLILAVQNQVTTPSFSYRRKKDIRDLIKTVRKSLKVQNDTVTFSEEQALRLTLKKFVELTALVNDLDAYDDSLVPYYKGNKVRFSNGPEVELHDADQDKVLKALAQRIYSTRNALVHSKDGEKAKYTPFADDHELAKELPLLRFIAERTILSNSTMIE
ncbi:hypothetical protein [Rosistilla ulvae]|nr:hypothetical protein [Rosistilla ulvae]